MHVRRLAAVGLLAAAAVPTAPAPALAHGSPTTPISRNSACAGNGTRRDTAACKAALKATGGFLGAYDNLRLANVASDRERIPDGELCSGGLDAYRGLDLARDDFPATKVTSGQNLRIAYRGTIPHQGSFRLFLTDGGYEPTAKLAWSDLTKLDEIKDPPLTGGSYRMSVELPKRTGRHILYVVWETSSTPDTYYSCSDLVFPEPVATSAPSPSPSRKPSPSATAEEPLVAVGEQPVAGGDPTVSSGEPAVTAVGKAATRTGDDSMIGLGHWLIGGAIGVAALVAAGAGLSRLRRLKSR
ncbi:MAG TPA: lytic polysaccharide monooxygenase [Actinoplanes sp.]|nr:lytic polysaccharide monooxygenase [Actinoplanes sp.]